ncbi:substrate-binding periplasmic protein [Curvibacter lanceolatus]|jgi:polar amino acid transport system substrate-binding protein|uniref:substrate-binding periplasmic protein n=1 Tax=Curvibacter lanceolatus TaxID=86182 RepID=UPI00038297D0|nr:transporter substrate-binding domain-containing protein [Curvibacter lanceolatus]
MLASTSKFTVGLRHAGRGGLLLWIALASWASSSTVQAQGRSVVALYTEDSPPLNMLANGRIIGSSVEKVVQIFALAGIEQRLELLPWARAYQYALDKPEACVFSTTRTPEREGLFKWVGPLARSAWLLYARKEEAVPLQSLEQARGELIAGYHLDAVAEHLSARGYSVDYSSNELAGARKLLSGRVKYWASSQYSSTVLIQQYRWQDKVVPVLQFNRVDLYLACHRNFPEPWMRSLRESWQQMLKDGSANTIDERYRQWVAPQPVQSR